jgi:hypothetical protein
VVAGSCRQPQTSVKLEAAITVLDMLMMSSVSLETCSAIKKHWNNKFYHTSHLVGYFYKKKLSHLAYYSFLSIGIDQITVVEIEWFGRPVVPTF